MQPNSIWNEDLKNSFTQVDKLSLHEFLSWKHKSEQK